MNDGAPVIFLIAPNVSEQMGGEAIKALQIFREFKKVNQRTYQITHERCREELSGRLNFSDICYIKDTLVAKVLWRSIVLRSFLDYWFSIKAVKMAETIAASKAYANQFLVIHQTEPNSPVTLRRMSNLCVNVVGPINGNIYYPAPFRSSETLSSTLRQLMHLPAQRLSAGLFRRAKSADLVLAAGGDRTVSSLLAAGYDHSVIRDTIDCGVPDALLDRPRITHRGRNF